MELLAQALKILLPLFDLYLRSRAKDEQAFKDYIEWNEIMARSSLRSVQKRLKANDQIQAAMDEWAKEDRG